MGGHGALAVKAINAALVELDEAARYADTHHAKGTPSSGPAKPPLSDYPEEARYKDLREARRQIERGKRLIENATEWRAAIGTFGGHGEKAVEHLNRALEEITQAERWVDAHG
jgi:hypothetical protein